MLSSWAGKLRGAVVTSRTRNILIAAGIVANITALAVLFWLVLDLRADTNRLCKEASRNDPIPFRDVCSPGEGGW